MFVVLEGIDGCGKTTQAGSVAGWLSKTFGREGVVSTREPGGWAGGDVLRNLVLHRDFENPWSEWFLFMLDRCEHVARVIAPALRAGKVVVSDRYTPSTIAYQVLGNEDIPRETAEHVMKTAQLIGLPKPDIVFFLDISVEDAQERLGSRAKRDSFDARGREYFERVRDGYETVMKSEGADGSWIRINANQSAERVFADICSALSAKIGIMRT